MSKFASIGLIFAAFGAVFAGIGGYFFYEDQRFAEGAISVEGTIIEMERYRDSEGDTMYRPIAEFYDSDWQAHTIVSKTSTSSPAFDVGESVKVLYHPDDPAGGRIDSFSQRYLFPVIFGGMGGLFILIGGGMAVSQWLRKRTVARLREKGVRVEGTVTRIVQDMSVAVNDEHPWRIEAEARHPRTGQVKTYKSDAIWGRPSGVEKGDSVPVFLSATNGKHSFVDVDAATPGKRDADVVSGEPDEYVPFRKYRRGVRG